MLEDFFESVNDAWQNFFDFCEAQGIPLKTAANALEEKGIPALPVFAAVLLALVGAGVYFLAPGIAEGFLPQPNATVTVQLNSFETGLPLAVSGISVRLMKDAAEDGSYPGLTDADGVVQFEDVLPGDYAARVVDLRYSGEASVSAEGGKGKALELSVREVLKQKVKLTVDVRGLAGGTGPGNASVVLFDAAANPVASGYGSTLSFDVDSNATYSIVVNSSGWNENSTVISVGSGDKLQVVSLSPREGFDSFTLRFRVVDKARPDKYVANASIILRDAATEKALFSPLLTSDDGGTKQENVSVGLKLVVLVNADGFEPLKLPYTTERFNDSLRIALERVDPSGLKKLSASVVDANGNAVSGASVQLFQGNFKAAYPLVVSGSKGTADFRVREGEYLVTAYKAGFLPAAALGVPAGGSVELKLEPSLGNSGSVRVTVQDENAVVLPEASVSLLKSDGKQFGIPEKVTGIDGSVVFQDVPFEEVFARASKSGRVGESSRTAVVPIGETGLNATLLSVTLLPQKGSLNVFVRDHFSRKPVSGAVVEVSTRETASCTTSDGSCSVSVTEGFARVKATANGYNDYSSSEVEVKPNVQSKLDAEIVSRSVSTGIKATLAGVFDAAGRKVNSLGPSSKYTARLLLTSPPGVNYSKALLHFRVGTVESGVDSDAVFITGYDASGSRVNSGASYEAAGADLEPIAAGNESVATASPQVAPETGEYKWVTFEFSKFAGTKEIAVDLRTRQVTNGSALLGYRTAFTLSNETLRDPADAQAGVSKDESLAAVNSKAFEISFDGICEEDLCLQSVISSKRGKFSENFEAQVPETFQLRVKSFSTELSTLSLSISSASDSVKLIDAQSGAAKGALINTESGPELSVATQPGREEAVFSLQALRPSNSVEINLRASSRGTTLMQLSFSGRMVTERNASLSVRAAPDSLKALVDNKVLFTVKDEYGNPIKDAHIVVGSSNDALGTATDLLGTNAEGAGLEGRYFVEGIRPQKVGAVAYTVEATGFSQYKSRLRVDAKEIIQAQPSDKMLIDVSAKQPPVDTAIIIQNQLDNDVRVQASIILSSPKNLTQFSIDSTDFKIEPSSSKQLLLSAKIADEILSISNKDRTLTEKANGTLQLVAKVGRSTQTIIIPFEASSTFEQRNLDDLWSIGGDSEIPTLEFTIDLDNKGPANQSVSLMNDAPYPLLLNHQTPSNPDWLSVSPLSRVLPALSEEESEATPSMLFVEARVPKKFEKDDCVFEGDDVQNATIQLFASYQGIISKKELPVILKLYSSSNCAPSGGTTISLPIDSSFTLPANTKKKRNEDTSFAVLLPSNDRMLFSDAAQVDDTGKRIGVIVPSNASMTLPSKFVSIASATKFEFWLPFEVKYELGPQQQKINNKDGTITIVFQSQDKITFPSGTSFPINPEMQGGFNAVVPANGHVIVDKATLESSTCATSVIFPNAATMTLPSGTTTEKTESTGDVRAKLKDCETVEVVASDGTFVRLPQSNTFDFAPPSVVQPTTEGTFVAKVDGGKAFKFYACSAQEGSLSEYVLKFPIQTTILVPKNASVDSSTISFGSCEKIERVDADGTRTSFPSARTMTIADGQALPQDEQGNTPFVVPANAEITVQSCPCVPGSADSVTISYAYKYLQLANDTIQFNLSDSKKEDSKDACLFNKGTDSINIKATASVDQPGMTNLGATGFIKDADMKFAKEFEKTTLMPPTEQGAPCLPFRIKATLPENLLDEYGCIKNRKENTDYVGKIRFEGETTKGIPIGANYAPILTATINVKANNNCWYEAKKNVNKALQEFYVNYDMRNNNPRSKQGMLLAFKDKGHERFVTLVNNRDEEVEVKASYSGEGLIKCFKDTESNAEFGTQAMQAGTALVIRCDATGEGALQGTNPAITFTAKGKETQKESTHMVAVAIFKVEGKEAQNLYYSTPIGELAPKEAAAAPQQVPGQFQQGQTGQQPVPPLKDATTGAIVPEQPPAQGTGTQTGTQQGTQATQAPAKPRKTIISFAEEGGQATSTDSQADASTTQDPQAEPTTCENDSDCVIGQSCENKKCTDLVSKEAAQELGQGAYPNAAPASALPAPEGVNVPASTLTGKQMATTDDYFTTCELNYCDYEQSKRAYSSFLANVKGYITWISSDEKQFQPRLNQFCQRSRAIFGGEGAYSKAFALQLANTVQSLDFLEADARTALALGPDAAVRLEYGGTEDSRQLKGCGTYEIRASLDICKTGAPSIEEWKKQIAVEIRTTKLHECKPTLANAPLFIGTNSTDLGITVGRRLVHWPDELFSFEDYKTKFVATNPLTWISGVWSLGPYGHGHSEMDKVAARDVYSYFYQNDQQTPRGATPAQDYGEFTFCADHAYKQLLTVAGISLVATATSVALTPETAGLAAIPGAVMARVGATAPIAAGTCVGGLGRVVAVPFGVASGGGCAVMNDCIKSTMFLGTSAALPKRSQLQAAVDEQGKSVGSIVTAWNKAGSWKRFGKYAAGSAVLSGFTSVSPEIEGASVPLVIGGGPAILTSYKKISEKIGSAVTASAMPNAVSTATAAIQPVPIGEFRPIFMAAQDAIINGGQTPTNALTTAIGATNVALTVSEKAALEKAMVPVLTDIQTTGRTVNLNTAYGRYTSSLTTASAQAVTQGRLATLLAKLKEFDKAEFAKGLVQAASLLMFDVNVRPVQATIDERLSSHIVTYHLERKVAGQHFPTAYKLCVQKKGMAGTDQCDDSKSFLLPNLCNSDRNACLYSMPLPTTSTTAPQGYNLIFVKNDETLDSNQLLDSVFNPSIGPLAKEIGILDGGELSKKEIEKLKTTLEDTGSGKGISPDLSAVKRGEVNILDEGVAVEGAEGAQTQGQGSVPITEGESSLPPEGQQPQNPQAPYTPPQVP